MYLPEEFIIIGAALEVTPQGARLKNTVTNSDINRYRRVMKFQIEFDEELLQSIVNTLKKSLNDVHKSVNYNSKKIGINRVIDG